MRLPGWQRKIIKGVLKASEEMQNPYWFPATASLQLLKVRKKHSKNVRQALGTWQKECTTSQVTHIIPVGHHSPLLLKNLRFPCWPHWPLHNPLKPMWKSGILDSYCCVRRLGNYNQYATTCMHLVFGANVFIRTYKYPTPSIYVIWMYFLYNCVHTCIYPLKFVIECA